MSSSADSLINYLRTVAGAWRDDPRSDDELLTRFAESRDDAVFKVLVGRHGPMVWRTGMRVLGDGPGAEDVFQVTFLTLARKAGRLGIKNLAGWLHRVARQAALNADSSDRRRRDLENQLRAIKQPAKESDPDQAEVNAVLDEELTHLPERLRVPLILRYLEGKTLDEVASIVGCSRPVVSKRLIYGENALRERLERRGLAIAIGSIAAILGNTSAGSAMPAGLIRSTAHAAVAFRSRTLTGVTADSAEKLLRSLSVKGSIQKGWWLVLTCVGALGLGGAGWMAWKMFGEGSDTVTSTVQDVHKTSSLSLVIRPHDERVDLYGDPLPEGALARMGTTRFRGGDEGFSESNKTDRNRNLESNVALSSDGKTLIMACHRGIFWDVVTGKQLSRIAVKCERVTFSPDGKLLAAQEKREMVGGRIRLFDAATGQAIGEPLCGWGAALFSPDGKTIAYACGRKQGGAFHIYDIEKRELLRKIGREAGDFSLWPYNLASAQFSHDGRSLACVYVTDVPGKIPSIVDIVDVETGKNLATLEYQQEVVQLAFSLEGNIVTSGKDKVIRIQDAKTKKELQQLGPMEQVPTVIALLPNGKTLLGACSGQICFWDLATGRKARPTVTCKGLLRPILLSSDGTKLIEQIGNAVSMWDVTTGKEIGPVVGAPRVVTRHMAFSPDGALLATGVGTMWQVLQVPGIMPFCIWESSTGKQLGSLPISAETKFIQSLRMAWPFRDTVLAEGTFLSCEPGLVVQPKLRMTRWKITPPTNAVVGELSSLSDAPGIFSPDGRVLASQRDEKCIELLDTSTGKKLASVRSPYPFDNLAFSADHQILVTQPVYPGDIRGRSITLWETATGHKLYSFDLPARPLERSDEDPTFDQFAGISPDGRLIATWSPKTYAITLWEHVSGQVRWRFSPPAGCRSVRPHVAFSSDCCRLAAGYLLIQQDEQTIQERSINVWDLTSGQECQCFRDHRVGALGGESPEVVFSPDGRRLASAGLDYTVLIWEIKPTSTSPKVTQPLSQMELQALMATLAANDATAAYLAIDKLRRVPDQAVPLAEECLRPQRLAPSAERKVQEVDRLIEDLDSDDFQARTKAAQELRQKLSKEDGDKIVQNTLAKAQAGGKLSIEVNKTVRNLLAELKDDQRYGGAKSPELTRMFRAIELLELIHNNLAREILQKVVTAPPQPEVGRLAQAALKRLESIPSVRMP